VVEYPVAGDPPPILKPYRWSVQFISTPKAVAPGLCGADLLGVVIEAEAKVAPGRPDASKRAVEALPARVFRVVGPLQSEPELTTDQAARIQAACDRLRPIGRYFLNGDAFFPGDKGAFSADDDATAWTGVRLLQRAAELARNGGGLRFDLTCGAPGSRVCQNPRSFLAARTSDDLIDIANVTCLFGGPGERCLRISVLEAGRTCGLTVEPRAGRPDARSIYIKCDERDFSQLPWRLERLFRPYVITSD
jgi:hypothetical protein